MIKPCEMNFINIRNGLKNQKLIQLQQFYVNGYKLSDEYMVDELDFCY